MFVISLYLSICKTPENATDENRQDLLAELNTMKKLEPHQNVIQLLGCVTKSGKRVKRVSLVAVLRSSANTHTTDVGVWCSDWQLHGE